VTAPAAVATPLSPGRYKLQLTIGEETLEKLRLAKDMLGQAPPVAEAAILDRALVALLRDLAREKFADTRRPRPSRGTKPRARSIAAAVKRAVWVRDLGRCAFVGTRGHRCNERRFLEFHHVAPVRPGRRGQRRSDRPSLPEPQRLRRQAVFREAQICGRERPGE
jgi:hypothetical protein